MLGKLTNRGLPQQGMEVEKLIKVGTTPAEFFGELIKEGTTPAEFGLGEINQITEGLPQQTDFE